MIEVNKCNIDCKYINDPWENHVIIDQSELIAYSKNKNNHTNFKDLDKLSIDVSSYEKFKAFVENLEEVNENERTTDKKIKIIKDNTPDDNFYYKSKSTKPTFLKINPRKKIHRPKKEYKIIQDDKSFTLEKRNVKKNLRIITK